MPYVPSLRPTFLRYALSSFLTPYVPSLCHTFLHYALRSFLAPYLPSLRPTFLPYALRFFNYYALRSFLAPFVRSLHPMFLLETYDPSISTCLGYLTFVQQLVAVRLLLLHRLSGTHYLSRFVPVQPYPCFSLD